MPRQVSIDWLQGRTWRAQTRGLQVTGDSRLEDGGENLGLTPAELLVAAIGLCTGLDLSYYAERHPSVDLSQIRMELTWTLATDRPTRIEYINMRVILPNELSEAERATLTRIANSCLVHNTVERGAEVSVTVE